MPLNNPMPSRTDCRRQLLDARKAWSGSPQAAQAQAQLHERVMAVLAQLEPACLGLYWPMQGEFNPREAALAAHSAFGCKLALPYAQKSPAKMHFRAWDGQPPASLDECGLPSPEGAPIVPDVVLVPCVGFTSQGYRVGYGGGYFDRYLAAHPEVTAIGVAWENSLLADDLWQPQAHDVPLMVVLTESNTWDA